MKKLDNKILPQKYSQTYYAKYMRNYRKKNPEYLKRGNERVKERRLELIDLLGGKKCVKCGFDDVRALHIDHINGGGFQDKLQGTAKMIGYYLRNLDVAKKELQVLCANCNFIKQQVNHEFLSRYRKK